MSGTNSYFKIQGLKVATIYDVHMAAATKGGFGPESEQQAIRTTNIGNCSGKALFQRSLDNYGSF